MLLISRRLLVRWLVDDLIGGYHAVEPAEPVTELTCTYIALDRMGDHGTPTGAELKGAL